MAVGLTLDFDSYGLQDYDAVCGLLNFPADWPDGLLAHGATEVDGRLRVVDVWESREKFDRFAAERLGPANAQGMGDRAQEPVILERELHSFYATNTR
jgi:hypothetical protein